VVNGTERRIKLGRGGIRKAENENRFDECLMDKRTICRIRCSI